FLRGESHDFRTMWWPAHPHGSGLSNTRVEDGEESELMLSEAVWLAMKLARRICRRVRRWVDGPSFRIWRCSSLRRYGPMRPIQYRGHRFVVLSNDWRAFWLATRNDVNPQTRVPLRALLDLKPSLYVDVGANYGEFVAEALARGIRTVAIEPNPDLVACLQRTFGQHERLTILN